MNTKKYEKIIEDTKIQFNLTYYYFFNIISQ